MRTYGQLRYGNHCGRDSWGIFDLEPHVAMAFKRLFPKVNPADTRHVLSDNDDNRADIAWFISRYPLECKPICIQLLEQGAERMAAKIASRDAVLSLQWKPEPVEGDLMKIPPYLYQEQAAQVTLDNPGLLLGDDVGLGKTISTFAAAARGAPLPMAIVVDSHLVRQWVAKAEKFTRLRAHGIKSSTPYSLPDADLYVFSYGMVSGWIDYFAKNDFPSCTFDEIQNLRHGTNTDKGKSCMVLSKRAQVRLGLSATPVYNYGDEIHTIMSFINDTILGTREEFLREWCSSGGVVNDPDALGSFLQSAGWLLRRVEDDEVVDQSMPPPNLLDFEMDFDKVAMSKEEDLLKHLATTVLTGRFEESGRASRELDVKMRHITGVIKAKPVAEYVKMLLKDRKKVLLAGWHRDVYDKWRYMLDAYDPVLYTGSESAAGKARNVARFVEGDSRVMMISLRSGAGLDGLQFACKDVVYGELDWSPQVHKQLLGRVRRPGQLEQCTGHTLHVNGGSDPVLMSMLGVKSDQSRGIMMPGKAIPMQVQDMSRVKEMAKHLLGAS